MRGVLGRKVKDKCSGPGILAFICGQKKPLTSEPTHQPGLSILVPAYNEEKTIVRILDLLFETQLPDNLSKEVIVVNDCSNDKTGHLLDAYQAQHPNRPLKVRHLDRNQGKGHALRTGLAMASLAYVVVQDADLEYDPNEFALLLGPLLSGRADAVYGSRFMGGNPHRILFFWHTIGNKFLTFLSNSLTNLNLTDMETCYKMIRTPLAQGLTLQENRFGFEPEITARLSQVPGIRIYEVGISYYGRTYAEGKKINWKDGFRAIFCILKYNLWAR
ncbi:MAG: glycosyltransferase family 2 protein [Cytophagia bacterium]|nr:glycosyltransferase family 2 protein [Cytophagia bacterium]